MHLIARTTKIRAKKYQAYASYTSPALPPLPKVQVTCSLCVLALVAPWAAAAEGAGEREVYVLLAVQAHHERGHIHDLLAHTARRRRRRQKKLEGRRRHRNGEK